PPAAPKLVLTSPAPASASAPRASPDRSDGAPAATVRSRWGKASLLALLVIAGSTLYWLAREARSPAPMPNSWLNDGPPVPRVVPSFTMDRLASIVWGPVKTTTPRLSG